MENTLIEISDMCKIYNPGENEVRALDGVDLQISENEFVAIIGHSGSGKSTLMNTFQPAGSIYYIIRMYRIWMMMNYLMYVTVK